MNTGHLTPDELEALARGEDTDRDVEQHIRSCAECREAVREGIFATRYVRPLAGDHPDEHVLTALWSNALSPSRREDVKRHVATCSRCRALLERLVRATPPESNPSCLDDRLFRETTAWAATSSSPRRATLVVRGAAPSEPLQASFVSIAEALRPLRSNARPPALTDGRLAFSFKLYREGAATHLAVYLVKSPVGVVIPPISVSLAAASGPKRHAGILAGAEAAVLELSPGTSHLVIEARPPWEIEVRFDA